MPDLVLPPATGFYTPIDTNGLRTIFVKDEAELLHALQLDEPRYVLPTQPIDVDIPYNLVLDKPYLVFVGAYPIRMSVGQVSLRASNVLIQDVAFECNGLYDRGDALQVVPTVPFDPNIRLENICLNHCAMLWGDDESLSIKHTDNTTLINSVIAEARLDAPRVGGRGFLDLDNRHIAILGNLFASNACRNPEIHDSTAVIRGNHIHNGGFMGIHGAAWATVIENTFTSGPDVRNKQYAIRIFGTTPQVYMEANYFDGNLTEPWFWTDDTPPTGWEGETPPLLDTPPIWCKYEGLESPGVTWYHAHQERIKYEAGCNRGCWRETPYRFVNE